MHKPVLPAPVEYHIPCVSMRLPRTSAKPLLFRYAGRDLSAEKVAAAHYERDGWSVFGGTRANYFFSVAAKAYDGDVDAAVRRAEETAMTKYRRRVDRTLFGSFAAELRSCARGLSSAILTFYRGWVFCPKGVPDLFLARNGEIRFVEVKGGNDRLSALQLDFAEAFLTRVSADLTLFRVVPERG